MNFIEEYRKELSALKFTQNIVNNYTNVLKQSVNLSFSEERLNFSSEDDSFHNISGIAIYPIDNLNYSDKNLYFSREAVKNIYNSTLKFMNEGNIVNLREEHIPLNIGHVGKLSLTDDHKIYVDAKIDKSLSRGMDASKQIKNKKSLFFSVGIVAIFNKKDNRLSVIDGLINEVSIVERPALKQASITRFSDDELNKFNYNTDGIIESTKNEILKTLKSVFK